MTILEKKCFLGQPQFCSYAARFSSRSFLLTLLWRCQYFLLRGPIV